MNIYHPSTEKKFWIAPIAREDLIENIVQEADIIFVSPMCWDEMRKRTPAGKKLKTYENFISQETIDHLRLFSSRETRICLPSLPKFQGIAGE